MALGRVQRRPIRNCIHSSQNFLYFITENTGSEIRTSMTKKVDQGIQNASDDREQREEEPSAAERRMTVALVRARSANHQRVPAQEKIEESRKKVDEKVEILFHFNKSRNEDIHSRACVKK